MLLCILEFNNLGIENLNAFIRKSMILTVNQRVAGSSPAGGALKMKHLRYPMWVLFSPLIQPIPPLFQLDSFHYLNKTLQASIFSE